MLESGLTPRWSALESTCRAPGGVRTGSLGPPGGPAVKNLPDNAGDTGSIPGPGRSHMPRGN